MTQIAAMGRLLTHRLRPELAPFAAARTWDRAASRRSLCQVHGLRALSVEARMVQTAAPTVTMCQRRWMASESGQIRSPELPENVPRAIRVMAKALGINSKESQAIRNAKTMYSRCFTQSELPQWAEVCRLPDTFMSWFFLTHLHVWMAMVRLQTAGEDGVMLSKELYEVFWEDVEHRIRLTGVDNNTTVTRSLKEINQIFWGCLVAYDEGLLYDDIALAGALWRNMFDMRPDTSLQTLSSLVEYIRREVLALDLQSDDDIVQGRIVFGKVPAPAKC